ncbi:hypothetical protein EMMF5_004511 [Cystobasidiomycetes sp. EMM_F5]
MLVGVGNPWNTLSEFNPATLLFEVGVQDHDAIFVEAISSLTTREAAAAYDASGDMVFLGSTCAYKRAFNRERPALSNARMPDDHYAAHTQNQLPARMRAASDQASSYDPLLQSGASRQANQLKKRRCPSTALWNTGQGEDHTSTISSTNVTTAQKTKSKRKRNIVETLLASESAKSGKQTK